MRGEDENVGHGGAGVSDKILDYGEPFWVLHDPDALDHLKVWIMEGPDESEEPDVHDQAVAYLHSDVDLAKRFAVCANALKGCPDPKAFVESVKKLGPLLKGQDVFPLGQESFDIAGNLAWLWNPKS